MIYHGYVRATRDSDLLVHIASLASVVGFKRLAGRPQDQLDLKELEAIYGSLPVEEIPGLDT